LGGEKGMATLETALMVPVLFLITFLFLSGISLGVQTLALSDATRTAARELARGASEESVRQGFFRSEPTARLQIIWDVDTVAVETLKPGEFGVSFLGLSPFELSQKHIAPREWINAQ
jgi:Flp pilus assembly protein TadG